MFVMTPAILAVLLVLKGACALLMLWLGYDAFRTPPRTPCHILAMCVALFLGVMCVEFMWYDIKHMILHWDQPDNFVERVRGWVG